MKKKSLLWGGFLLATTSVIVSSIVIDRRQGELADLEKEIAELERVRQRASSMVIEADAKLDLMTLLFIAKKAGTSSGLGSHLDEYVQQGILVALRLQCTAVRSLEQALGRGSDRSIEKRCKSEVDTHQELVEGFLAVAGGDPEEYQTLRGIAATSRKDWTKLDGAAVTELREAVKERADLASSVTLSRSIGLGLTVLGLMMALLKDLND